jgi:hypothetical protein
MNAGCASVALAAALLLAQPVAAQAPAADPPDLQRAFASAMRAEADGQMAQAIEMLTALEAQTAAPRVKLELARMLFQAGEHRRARAMFAKVYRQDLPYPVRRRVNLFLDDLDQRLGYVRPSLGIRIDDNPTQQPGSGTYRIFGSPFEFTKSARPEASLTWRMDALAPLAERAGRQWQLRAEADGLTSRGKGSDHVGGEVSLRLAELEHRSHAAIGWRVSESGGLEANAAFVEYQRRITPSRKSQLTVVADLELNRLSGGVRLSGRTARLTVDFARDLGPDTTARLGGGGSLTSIGDPQWPKLTAFGQAVLIRSLPKRNLSLVAGAGLAITRFEGPDLFFGLEREDRSISLQLAAYLARPVLGFFPGLVLSRDVRRSNIRFFDYDRTGASMDFRRRF